MKTQALGLASVGLLMTAGAFQAHAASAQGVGRPNQPDTTLSAETRKEVIAGALKKLNEGYVFPDVAKRMEAAIQKRLQSGEYDGITSADKLAKTLTEHLQAVSHDKHLRVRYSYEALPDFPKDGEKPD